MNNFLNTLLAPVSLEQLAYAFCFLRICMGILSVGHGLPKVLGGIPQWEGLGAAMKYIGINFWFGFWGFMAACVEFFGGIALILGLGTRIAAALLCFTMIVAFIMHRKQKDPFMVYSFALTLLAIYATFIYTGSGILSLDSYLYPAQAGLR